MNIFILYDIEIFMCLNFFKLWIMLITLYNIIVIHLHFFSIIFSMYVQVKNCI